MKIKLIICILALVPQLNVFANSNSQSFTGSNGECGDGWSFDGTPAAAEADAVQIAKTFCASSGKRALRLSEWAIQSSQSYHSFGFGYGRDTCGYQEVLATARFACK